MLHSNLGEKHRLGRCCTSEWKWRDLICIVRLLFVLRENTRLAEPAPRRLPGSASSPPVATLPAGKRRSVPGPSGWKTALPHGPVPVPHVSDPHTHRTMRVTYMPSHERASGYFDWGRDWRVDLRSGAAAGGHPGAGLRAGTGTGRSGRRAYAQSQRLSRDHWPGPGGRVGGGRQRTRLSGGASLQDRARAGAG